jgi:spore maturation protein CgeB
MRAIQEQAIVQRSIDIVVLGLAITSSWGNGHATTYRSLVKGLQRRGHRVLFLERDQPWYAAHRDAPELPYCETQLYSGIAELQSRYASRVRNADAVIVGSYVPDGALVCRWVLDIARGVRMFYDIDTPVTLSRLEDDSCDYLRRNQVPHFDALLSFTGGPTLQRLESQFGARRALPLYCSVDVDSYRPSAMRHGYDLGYMGTYSADRQPGLEQFLNAPARLLPQHDFAVVGAQYPTTLQWPDNVARMDHLPPDRHADFYCSQRFTLNLTRDDMKRAGYSPSVRLFEAAACGVPIVSDDWPGLDTVLRADEEILIARSSEDVVGYVRDYGEAQRCRIGEAGRARVAVAHSSARRAAELEHYIETAACAVPPVPAPLSKHDILRAAATS